MKQTLRRMSALGLAAYGIAAVMCSASAAPAAGLRSELKPLTFFVGRWDCAGRFASGKPIASTETFSAVLGGRWLTMRHADNPPHRYRANEYWGYDSATGDFRIDLFDNSGNARRYTSSGWDHDQLVLRRVVTGAHRDRFVFQRHGESAYLVTYARQTATGGWRDVDTLTCKRR